MPTDSPTDSSSFSTHARRCCFAAAAALLLTSSIRPAAAAQPPAAGPADGVPRLAVSYRDLDISGPRGAMQLLHRIEVAAHLVCGDLAGPQPLPEAVRARECYTQAVARAVQGVHARAVTAVYVADFGTPARARAPRS